MNSSVAGVEPVNIGNNPSEGMSRSRKVLAIVGRYMCF